MRRNHRERGEGQLGCVFGVIILLLAVFVAWKLIPVKIKAAEMRQTIIDEAKQAGTRGDEAIMKNILTKAEEVNLPITKDDVVIVRGKQDIAVDLSYTVPVTFPGYVYQWKFHHRAENPIF
jgi:predicted membrane protein